LVHRDVKPANILLEDGVERVRLTDFGLARAAADAAMTHSGLVAGTPHYMAPEQARGETTDHRADLFSLGSTLYAICAGHPPFRAETPLAVLRRVCDDEPRPLRAINPDVPAWLEAIVGRLMAKDPARRFQTAAEVTDVLGRCLAHVQQPLAVPLPPDIVARDTRPESGRRRLGWAAAVLGFAAVVGGALALGPWRSRGPQGPNDGIERPGSAIASRGSPPDDAAWGGPDEIARQIAGARGHAAVIEAHLHRGDPPDHDLVSDLAHDLAERSRSLEREVASDRDANAVIPTVDPIPNPDDRR
jgi:serine/threonine protein kinase